MTYYLNWVNSERGPSSKIISQNTLKFGLNYSSNCTSIGSVLAKLLLQCDHVEQSTKLTISTILTDLSPFQPIRGPLAAGTPSNHRTPNLAHHMIAVHDTSHLN